MKRGRFYFNREDTGEINSIIKFVIVLCFLVLRYEVDAIDVADTTREQKILDGEFWRDQVLNELMPLWYEHARDEEHGTFYLNLSRDWQPMSPWEKMPAMISRQIFSFSTAYLLSGEERYLNVAREAVKYLLKYGWDEEYGGWYETISKTGEPKNTEKVASSQIYGGVFLEVAPDGSFLGSGQKAGPWHTSFHEIEHGFLNYLNLNFYVNKKPVVLHFNLDGPAKHYVSPVSDPKVQIAGVLINGMPWLNFDARERSILLPEGKGMNVVVTLSTTAVPKTK